MAFTFTIYFANGLTTMNHASGLAFFLNMDFADWLAFCSQGS